MIAAISFAALSALCNASAAVLQHLANVEAPAGLKSVWKVTIYLVRQPTWLLGGAFMIGTFVFSAVALYFGELSVVQPMLVLELIFVLMLRAFFVHDDIAGRTFAAALAICAGLAGFLVAAHPRKGAHLPDAHAWAIALATRAVVVAVLIVLARSGSPGRRAALTASAAGVVWSVDAAFVKAATELLAARGWLALAVHWQLYAVIATGVLGTFLVQASLHVGPLAPGQAALLIVDPIASIILGVELFGDRLHHSPAAIAGASVSLLVLVAGVVLMSVWAPPVMEGHSNSTSTPRTSESGSAERIAQDPG